MRRFALRDRPVGVEQLRHLLGLGGTGLDQFQNVDDAAWRRERDAVLYGEWYCVGRRDDLGLTGEFWALP